MSKGHKYNRLSKFNWVLCALLLWSSIMPGLMAYETDQYSNRLLYIEDSLQFMDALVNQELQYVVAHWKGRRNIDRFAKKVYWRLGGLHWVDRLERLAMNHPDIAKLPQGKHNSIFGGMPLHATRVNFFFGVGRTVKVSGVLVGSDKFGHFFSQGLKYFKRSRRGWDLEKILARGAFVERWWFGYLTTGVYSNADLVANYEGMTFYNSLFFDDAVTGKKAIIGWNGNEPFVQRTFSWSDHVNDYWDEALNPSYLTKSLQKNLTPRLARFCADYHEQPELFASPNDHLLWERYQAVGLRDARYNRVDRACARLHADCVPSGKEPPSIAGARSRPM